MMSTTSLSSVVLLVLTAAMSLVAAYKVQHDSNRLFDEEKRASSLDRSSLVSPLLSSAVDSPDYQLGVRYDEYPLIVPKKRTALLVNRLMLALNEAMRDQDKSLDDLSFEDHKRYPGSTDDFRSMDLQRRGHGSVGQQKGRRFWKCYFNAVTCF